MFNLALACLGTGMAEAAQEQSRVEVGPFAARVPWGLRGGVLGRKCHTDPSLYSRLSID